MRLEENYPLEENEDCRALLITVRDRKEFEELILPKLKKVTKDIRVRDIFLNKEIS